MKKIVFFLIIVFFIKTATASAVPLDSILSSENLQKITENLNDLENYHGVRVIFDVTDSDGSIFGESLYDFVLKGLQRGPNRNWNVLVFYNVKKNQLRFVTYAHCSLGEENLAKIKGTSPVQDVLNSPSPSNEDISKMFLFISDELRNLILTSINSSSTCNIEITHKLKLKSNEYAVPDSVLKAIYSVIMDKSWEESNPGGFYVSQNFIPGETFDFLPFVTSDKKKFISLLEEKTKFSDKEIESYYKILTTEGNIVLIEDYPDDYLFHERIHEIIHKELTEEERNLLSNKKISDFDPLLSANLPEFTLVPAALRLTLSTGNWQEIYAYMAQYEKYPSSQDYTRYIDKEVYDSFSSNYPEEYKIYKKVFNLALR